MSPFQMFNTMEWWEIVGLLYCSEEWIRQQNKAMRDAEENAKIEQKMKDGSMKRYFKRNK